jgi:hypothetical protein
MAAKAQFEVDADTSGAVQAVENIGRAAQDATQDIKKLEAEQRRAAESAKREAEKSAQAVEKVGKQALGSIDQLTGGLLGKFKGLYDDLKKVNLGFKGMKAAIAATGIGLLVVALGEIVANWDSIAGFLNSASKGAKDLLKTSEDNVKAQQASLDAISEQENVLKAQGMTEREIRDLKIAQTKETIAALEAQLLAQQTIKNEQVAQAERNKQILQGIIRAITLPLSILLSTVDMVGQALGQDFGLEEKFSGGLANLVFDPEAIAQKGDEAIQETQKQLDKLKNQQAGFENQNETERKAREEKARQERFDRLNKENKEREDRIRTHEENVTRIQKEAADKRIKDRQAVVDYEQDMDMEAFNAELKRLEDKKTADEKAKKTREENLAKEQAYREQIQDLAVNSALGTISALSELNKLFDQNNKDAARKAFNREKALSIAQTIISTYTAAQKAYTSQLTLDPTAPVRAQIAAGVAIAGGLARIATISATKFNDTGSGGGGTPTTPSSSGASIPSQPPQFNIVGQGGTNQLAATIAGQSQRPVQAYVVGSQVNSQQELDRKRVRTASFG